MNDSIDQECADGSIAFNVVTWAPKDHAYVPY